MPDIKEITSQLQAWIDRMQSEGRKVDIDDINAHLAEIMSAGNASPLDRFNGFSPHQMHLMLNFPLEEECPVRLRTLSDEKIEDIPIMRQVLRLMTILADGELKLTASGYLPPKISEELYLMGMRSWSSDWYKQKSESKVEEVQVLRVIVKECGLVKTRSGRMSLTAKGKKLLSDRNGLLRAVMLFLLRDYNTGWLDLHKDSETANVGRLYSLWLLHHFGSEWRRKEFYAKEYFKAFPTMNNGHVYGFRTFDRLFYLIGLCRLNNREEDRGMEYGSRVIKADILEAVFDFTEP